MSEGRIRIGLSGWSYKHWQGDFYPDDLAQRDELAFAAARFPTLEVNRTFYSLVTPETMRRWHDQTPEDFLFAVKGSRFITHNKKLGNIEEPIANFVASGLDELNTKLGPILWQLGPNHRFDPGRLEYFIPQLPTRLANRRVRHAIEPRHESWFVPEMASLVRRHDIAIAFSHSSRWPYTEQLTADFVYVRLHGPRALYSSPYTTPELEEWARRIRTWAEGSEPEDARRFSDVGPKPSSGRDVYVYFDNDTGGHAPRQAKELIRLLA